MFYRLVTCNIGLQVSHEGIQDFSAFLHFPFAVIGLEPQIYLTVLSIPNNTLLSKPEHLIAHGQHTTINEKSASCSDLLSCLYNLKPTDLKVLLEVTRNENATLDEIAKLVQRDRSSVHRCLSKLVSANLVTKQTKTLKNGGYYHAYSMVELATIKRHAKERVKEITESLEALINNFESDLKKHLESNNEKMRQE